MATTSSITGTSIRNSVVPRATRRCALRCRQRRRRHRRRRAEPHGDPGARVAEPRAVVGAARGPRSPFATWFDIDWDAEGGRILMPVLDGSVDDNLAHLVVADGELQYFDHRFPLADGTSATRQSCLVRELLDAQHYRLADWRSAATQLNYRRFCDITTLIGLRVEEPAVFDASHAVLVELIADGSLDGLRIDHPDGLADPAGYLRRPRPRDRLDLGRGREGARPRASRLPPDWQAAGTTGYETLTVLNGLIVDPSGERPLSRLYTELTGEHRRLRHRRRRREAADRDRRPGGRDGPTDAPARRPAYGSSDDPLASDVFARAHDALLEVLCALARVPAVRELAATVAALDRATDGRAATPARHFDRRSRPCAPTRSTATSSACDSGRPPPRSSRRASKTPRSIGTRGCWRSTKSAATRVASVCASPSSTTSRRRCTPTPRPR